MASNRSAVRPPVSVRSHLTGSRPKMPMTWFIKPDSVSANIRRKMMPATTIEVSAGTNIADLKTAFTRGLPILELSTAASTRGIGIRRRRVRTMYRVLLKSAFQKIRSFQIRTQLSAPTKIPSPNSTSCVLIWKVRRSGTSQKASRVITNGRSEEHTSELQSRQYLVCRLLLEKKKTKYYLIPSYS